MRGTPMESVLVVGLLVTVAIALNVVVEQHGARVDLTQDGRHTLSEVTRGLLDAADAPIELRAFLPSRVQAPHSTTMGAIRDALDAYRDAAPGTVRVRVIDPTDPDASEAERARNDEEADSYGIALAELEIAEADRHVRQRVRYGVAVLYGDRRAVVGPIQHQNQIEFALSRALREVIAGPRKPRVIGIATGHGEPNLANSPVAKLLAESGTIQAVRLDGSPLPHGLDALVILGPRRAFDERARYVLDQFLMGGKTLLAFLDYRIPSELFPDVLVPTTTGLEPLFARYGLDVDHTRTVLDRTHNVQAVIGRDANGQLLTVHHPLYVQVRDLADHPVTRGLGSLAFPLAAPIKGGDGVQVLARTSDVAVTRREVRALDPGPLNTPPTGAASALESRASVPVAVVYRGEPDSAFVGRERPSAPTADGPFGPSQPERPFVPRAQGPARIVLATSGTRLLSAQRNGLLFLRNAIDWAVTDTDLSTIRARQAETPALESTGATARAWVKYGNLIGPSLLVLCIGGVRRLRRRRR